MILHQLSFFLLVAAGGIFAGKHDRGPSFDENYKVTWGYDHLLSQHQGRDVQLSLDQASGSGIESKLRYSSGFFHMRLKLPGNDSAGVVTTFYMTSHSPDGNELDFEFLGNREGKPHILQTNVFAHGKGDREQRTLLWFDPTTSFHTYRLLWNPHQIVFFIDNIPIRVFKNKSKIGVRYPTQPMNLVASIWNGDSWATDGGQTKINWTHSPFRTHLRSFGIDGCPSHNSTRGSCYSSKLWWNRKQYWALTPNQERAYQVAKKEYMIYDYCTDRSRYPKTPPECPQ